MDSKDYDGTEGLEFYPINDTECAVAVGKARLLKEIIIPSKYKNYTVTTIYGVANDGGFQNCSVLEKITLPDTIASIGSSAFSNCSSLTSITIPDSVTSIGQSAFNNCSSLTSITIPNSVTSIGRYAFYNCSSLSSITISNSVTTIGETTFYNCSSLTSIEIPSSVTSIGEYAFSSCSSLTSITIPFVGNTLNGTSNTHFGYIFGASSYYDNKSSVPSTLKEVIVTGGSSIGDYAFRLCSSLESITILDSVTSIGYRAFNGCSSLTSITIPDSVTSIGISAFEECNSLTIYCEAGAVQSGWDSEWNPSNRPVYWAGEWEYDADGNPTPII